MLTCLNTWVFSECLYIRVICMPHSSFGNGATWCEMMSLLWDDQAGQLGDSLPGGICLRSPCSSRGSDLPWKASQILVHRLKQGCFATWLQKHLPRACGMPAAFYGPAPKPQIPDSAAPVLVSPPHFIKAKLKIRCHVQLIAWVKLVTPVFQFNVHVFWY